MRIGKRNEDSVTGMGQPQCPGCGKFLPYDESRHYYHCSERCASADEWDMHPVAAFCSEKCADRFHSGRTA
jgi:endogenous inhibitor of DNA gyrase (YacG/DUF329 family)